MSNLFWNGLKGHKGAKELFETLVLNNKIPAGIILAGDHGNGSDYLALKFSHLLQLAHNGLIPETDTIPVRFEEPYIKYIFPLMSGTGEDNKSDDPFAKLSSKDIERIKSELELKNKNPYYQLDIPRANVIRINSIRSIRNYLSINYNELPYRTVLISRAEEMGDEAQNALLKSLEEPPERVIFILTANRMDSLLPTIRSRCWEITLPLLNDADMYSVLTENFEFGHEEVQSVIPFAEGSISEAVHLIDSELPLITENGMDILLQATAGNMNTAAEKMDELTRKAGDQCLPLFFRFILGWFKDAFRYKNGNSLLVMPQYRERYEKFVMRFPDVDFNNLIYKIESLYRVMNDSYMNKNGIQYRLFFELASVINPHIKNSTKVKAI